MITFPKRPVYSMVFVSSQLTVIMTNGHPGVIVLQAVEIQPGPDKENALILCMVELTVLRVPQKLKRNPVTLQNAQVVYVLFILEWKPIWKLLVLATKCMIVCLKCLTSKTSEQRNSTEEFQLSYQGLIARDQENEQQDKVRSTNPILRRSRQETNTLLTSPTKPYYYQPEFEQMRQENNTLLTSPTKPQCYQPEFEQIKPSCPEENQFTNPPRYSSLTIEKELKELNINKSQDKNESNMPKTVSQKNEVITAKKKPKYKVSDSTPTIINVKNNCATKTKIDRSQVDGTVSSKTKENTFVPSLQGMAIHGSSK